MRTPFHFDMTVVVRGNLCLDANHAPSLVRSLSDPRHLGAGRVKPLVIVKVRRSTANTVVGVETMLTILPLGYTDLNALDTILMRDPVT